MNRVSGAEPKPLSVFNKVKGTYSVTFDVKPDEQQEGQFTFVRYLFDHLPTVDEIRQAVNAYYNAETDAAIVSGFRYDDVPVWLSSENQFNFKAAFDLAVQTQGASLPVKFKFGTDEEPVYRTFATVVELQAFYTAALAYIQSCLEAGWAKKDAVDYSVYKLNEGEEE